MIYGQMQISESHAEATAEAVTHTQCWCKCVNDDTNQSKQGIVAVQRTGSDTQVSKQCTNSNMIQGGGV